MNQQRGEAWKRGQRQDRTDEPRWQRASSGRGGGRGQGFGARPRINLKEFIAQVYTASNSEGAFFDALRDAHRAHNIPMTTLYIHAMRTICEHDDLKLCERLLHRLRDGEVDMIVNSRMGGHEYTPLCRAAYRGSTRMVKALIASNADVNFVNVHGERLDDVLAEGERTAIEALPAETIFIRNRYEECRGFIEERRQWLIKREEREQREREQPTAKWVPRFRQRTEA